MKRLVYIWLVAWVLWGCQKEEAYFDVLVPADGLTFSPGGGRCSDALSFTGG